MSKRLFFALAASTTISCGGGLEDDAVQSAVQAAFTSANPSGRTGLELRGKTVWLQAPMFAKLCLEQKDLAFNDDPRTRPGGPASIPRISPTYKNQVFLTATTPVGYCVDLGSDPTLTIDEIRTTTEGAQVDVTIAISDPTPFFECLEPTYKKRTIQVNTGPQGEPVVASDVSLGQGACPAPLPKASTRKGAHRPQSKPKKGPSASDVRSALENLNEALWEADFDKALASIRCFNLFEEEKYGTCSASELLAVGPIPRGEMRPQDGTPWTEYVIDSTDATGKAVRDKSDPSLYHVVYRHPRTGRDRSLTLQWADGQWHLVGFVGRQAEGLTIARFFYDLHRKDKRAIFERRLNGEQIDENGHPLDPFAAPSEE